MSIPANAKYAIIREMTIEYLTQSKPSRQRGVLCELRKICRYLGRNDLLIALAGIHAVRHNRIIPVLDHEEQEQIKTITSDENVPLRDTAMILLGLSTGMTLSAAWFRIFFPIMAPEA